MNNICQALPVLGIEPRENPVFVEMEREIILTDIVELWALQVFGRREFQEGGRTKCKGSWNVWERKSIWLEQGWEWKGWVQRGGQEPDDVGQCQSWRLILKEIKDIVPMEADNWLFSSILIESLLCVELLKSQSLVFAGEISLRWGHARAGWALI